MVDVPAMPPNKILLATDLSGAADRALDRASELALTWNAELVIVHAQGDATAAGGHYRIPSWRQESEPADLIERQIRNDIRGAPPKLRVRIQNGRPLDVILDVARDEGADLLVTGMGSRPALGGLSKTLSEAFRQSPCSLLVVKTRPNGPYRKLLVGTDFTDEARIGLETAAKLFPAASLAILHAYDLPYKNLYLDPDLGDRFDAFEKQALTEWLKQANLDPDARERLTPFIEHGPPEVMLPAYARERDADLTVVGAYERGKLFHALVQGAGPKILEAAPGDILIVRAREDDS